MMADTLFQFSRQYRIRIICMMPAVILLLCLGQTPVTAQTGAPAPAKKHSSGFKSPVLYSVAASPKAAKVPSDTLHNKPAGMRSDSNRFVGNPFAVQSADSLQQQVLDRRLTGIQSQLHDIKTVIRNQAYEARLQYLRYQYDSVLQLRNSLLSGKMLANQDKLVLRIYDLQADSLRNEMDKLQRRAETAMDPADSSWAGAVSIPVYPAIPHSSDHLITATDTAALKSYVLSEEDILALKANSVQLKTGERYAKDSAYRKSMDSLDSKLARYEQLQQTADTASRTLQDSTVQRDLGIINDSLQQNKASLALLQAQLQAQHDSADYYQHLHYTLGQKRDSANLAARKWYNRIVPGKSKRLQNETEADWQEVNTREAYYNDALQRLNNQVNQLQERNSRLTENYQARRSRGYENDRPVIVRSPSYTDNAGLASLRTEIGSLRNQLLAAGALGTTTALAATRGEQTAKKDTVYIQPQVKMPATPDSVRANARTQNMQNEIERLKAELDSLKNNKLNPRAATAASAKDSISAITVYFGIGTAAIAAAQQGKLRGWARKVPTVTNHSFVLTGYTDATGNKAANNALAKKRMASIQNLLMTEFDISSDHIQLEEPVLSSGKKANALDRKVVIQVQ